jgi:hypothetical protein
LWDKVCLARGVPWEEGFCAGLIDSRVFDCLFSRGAINHPSRAPHNFSQLSAESNCDNVFLEYCLALQLSELGLMEKMYPVMIEDAVDESITPSPSYTHYFQSGCNPEAADVCVTAVESKVWEFLDKQVLVASVWENKTVAMILEKILANQGGFVNGEGTKAFEMIADEIFNMKLEMMTNAYGEDSCQSLEFKSNHFNRLSYMEQKNEAVKSENIYLRNQFHFVTKSSL